MTATETGTETVVPPAYPRPAPPWFEPIAEGGAPLDEPQRVSLPSGAQAWLVRSHEQVRTVLADRGFSRAAASVDSGAAFRGVAPPAGSLLALDPPDHTRLRSLVSKAFARAPMEAQRPAITQLVDELISGFADQRGPVDLVPALCLPLPVGVICRVLGVPAEDQEQFATWSRAFLSTSGSDRAAIGRAAGELAAYLGQLVGRRARDPQDDLLTALVQASHDDDRLSPQELVGLGIALLVAGYETTSAQLANALVLILSDPGRADWLRADTSRIPGAVEEILRFVSLGAGGGFPRIATEERRLGSVTIAAGDAVIPAIDSANRDPAAFERADELVWDRPAVPHLAFGHGLHFCLGAQLARLELTLGLEGLLVRCPDLRLAVDPDDLDWRQGSLVRSVLSLPVLL